MAKQVKYEGVLDRLSDLPDPILSNILWLLSIKDAVRTSILSTRWRYLFTSMSTIDYYHYRRSQGLNNGNIKEFTNLVDRLLYFPNNVGLSLECFRVGDLSSDNDDFRLYGWICATLGRDIKEIDIVSSKPLMLPSLLFTCQSFVTLRLAIYAADMKVPSDVCLPNLKLLLVRGFKFSDDSILRLISGCPVLEELAMVLVEFPRNIVFNSIIFYLKRLVLMFECDGVFNQVAINAPNLVYFKYTDLIAGGYCLSTMNSLEQADIRLHHPFKEATYNVNRELGVANLLKAICNVKSLQLANEHVEMYIRMPRKALLPFQKLVELKISNHHEDWLGTWLIEFLHCVPNLNTLHLILDAAKTGIKPLPKEVPSCLLFHLKEIEISCFEGDEHMFEMISYFLHHATILEKHIIELVKRLKPKEQLRITQKLLELPRNSKKCRVVTLL